MLATLRNLLGIDPVPYTIDGAFAELRTMCLRDHAAAEQVMITNDGVYAFFAEPNGKLGGVEATVVISADRKLGTAEVLVSLSGTSTTKTLGIGTDVLYEAYRFADCCRAKLRRWGMVK